jgi:hypothetical protein
MPKTRSLILNASEAMHQKQSAGKHCIRSIKETMDQRFLKQRQCNEGGYNESASSDQSITPVYWLKARMMTSRLDHRD